VSARKSTTTLPTNVKGLRAWLRGSAEGRAILREMCEEFLEEKCRECQQMRPFPKVLVVMRRLGRFPGAQVYVQEGVTVRMVEMPDVPDTEACEPRFEELLEWMLPKSWRSLLGLRARRIQSEVFRGVGLAEYLRQSCRLDVVRELEREL
jgi:hypothetical protein